ncbi:tripartite tricarboxylate transporter substrate binding protein [Verticiella sediminum]|uniref:Tripartite tricarboxylate transporter substrate binding protein n=1 Tax=Verticiella sediminum TaxID=1247510 RepID=A0A556AYH4_9BURK|nr:tripartite tricarboxylate transporter substrate binding protein [Verticiella sediminum]TSH97968.1 tripartite tricarboxylate transporter substrate binding protein [Verticiella sediminum]
MFKYDSTRRRVLALGAAAAAFAAWPLAHASNYPERPIRFIVPFNPGGGTDISARIVAEKLSGRLGQPIIIENRGGAAGLMGTAAGANADPDGYTFVFSLSTSLLINQFLFEKMPYDPQKDLVMVSQIATAPVVLAVHPSVPVNTGPELIAYIRQNQGKLSYGSWGVGSYAHLGGAYMSEVTKADMSHVPYKGEAAMLQDMLGGLVPMAFASAMGVKPHADTGRLKIIGTTGRTRMAVLPDTPTLYEQGLQDDAYSIVGWVGLAAPAKTPPEIVQRVSQEVAAVLAVDEVRERFATMGFTALGNTPEQFAANYQQDLPVWQALVQVSGARLD